MELKDHWNSEKVGMDEWGILDQPGVLSTEGLGPCIGLCLAYKGWAGIIHSSHPPHDEKEIGELIAEAKKAIPHEKLRLVRPILCGSDPEIDEDDPGLSSDEARQAIIDILRSEGFGEPIAHWSTSGQTAAVFANLEFHKVVIEIDYDDFEFAIFQD